MKHVTFTRDMIGSHRAREMRLVPDALAMQLAAEGAIAADAPDWPPSPGKKPAPKPAPPSRVGRRARELLGQTYLTK